MSTKQNSFLVYFNKLMKMFINRKIILLGFLSLFSSFKLAQSQSYVQCNGEFSLTQDGQIVYIYWVPGTDANTCTYTVKSPVDSFITATVYHRLTGSEPSCNSGQRAYVSRDASYNFAGASIFCGNRMSVPLQINSVGNEMTLAVQSNVASGDFQVVLKFTRLTQSNCQCR